MNPERKCPKCGTPLADNLAGWLCPKCLAQVCLGEKVPADQSASTPSPTTPAPPKRIRVLHVDDEERFTRLLKLNLERTGKYEVCVENAGAVAAQAAREFKPHVMLINVIMPATSGPEVYDQFKQDPELKHIPIIFFTATVRKETVKAHGGIIRGIPIIAKPASLEEIMTAIDKYATIPEGMRRCPKCSSLVAATVPEDQCPECVSRTGPDRKDQGDGKMNGPSQIILSTIIQP